MAQIENIDKNDKFLVVHQNFPHAANISTIANVSLAAGLSIFYSSFFSKCQFINISQVKTL